MCKRKGLTWGELCVVIAVIGILIAMLPLAVNKIREAAEQVQARHTEEKQPKDAAPEKPLFPEGVDDARVFISCVVLLFFFYLAMKYAEKKKEEAEST